MFQSIDAELFDIFRSRRPLIDVRAPVEFAEGALPGAINLPVLNDMERAAVGTKYKQAGPQAAIELGRQLVSGATRELRVRAWAEQIQARPDSMIHCFRGGLRSRSAVEALKDLGVEVPLLRGGYKRARQYFLSVLDQADALPTVVIGGMTGSGKTLWIEKHPEMSVDLEGLAHHRGSALGKRPEGQPSQIDFENRLATDLLRFEGADGPVVFEDEGRLIGTCVIPEKLFSKMRKSPLFVVEADRAARARNLIQIYLQGNFGFVDGVVPDAVDALLEFTEKNLRLIERRLGGARLKALLEAFSSALSEQKRTGHFDAHMDWVMNLLEWYYDPMYEYQLQQPHKNIVWRGPSEQLAAALQNFEASLDRAP